MTSAQKKAISLDRFKVSDWLKINGQSSRKKVRSHIKRLFNGFAVLEDAYEEASKDMVMRLCRMRPLTPEEANREVEIEFDRLRRNIVFDRSDLDEDAPDVMWYVLKQLKAMGVRKAHTRELIAIDLDQRSEDCDRSE